MKAVKVQYTVKESYVATNKKNIEKVMADLRALNNPGIKYSAFLLGDGKTFVHFAMYPDDATMSIVGELDAFKKFRQALKESQPEVPPNAEDLNLVASAYDFFA
ncbi:MAG: hypothetical protein HN736_13160 [Anaerolineae bacterium]|jgi:hypothetical protein|nr:hypothetical protein [Anaerolineae bacterium]MBT3714494.1 hypothetical protein [Anaerolineae bacterium]MBT4312695.1 hypothetical protein [Anaerolineae bacterium]MBT4458574.1 hypothetical protein [Anaerolineae bacterium]MBT4843372.1 hypothetical protein [Anaerolineae bacterium]